MTTASLRTLAVDAERRLAWDEAATLWEAAAEAYPQPHGELAQADIKRLRTRARSCKVAASIARMEVAS